MNSHSLPENLKKIEHALMQQNSVVQNFVTSLESVLSSSHPSSEINRHLQSFLSNSNDPQNDYRIAHRLLAETGLNIHDLFAEVIELSTVGSENEKLTLYPLAKATNEPPLLYLTAWNYFKSKRHAAAIDICDKIEPKVLDFELLKSECLIAEKNFEEACIVLEECAILAPQDGFVLKKLARVYLAMGKNAESLELLKQVTIIMGQDLEASWMLLEIGTFYCTQGKHNTWIAQWFQDSHTLLTEPQELRLACYRYLFSSEDKQGLASYASSLPWEKQKFIHEFLREASSLLQGTNEKGWHKVSAQISDLLQQKIS